MKVANKGSIKDFATALSRQIADDARPRSSQVHLIKGAKNILLLIPNGNQLYEIDRPTVARLEGLLDQENELEIANELRKLGINFPQLIDDAPLQSPKLYALSLAIAQKCNMGCTYCYADQGNFGGRMKNMSLDTALQSVDLLLNDCPEGSKAQLTFLGGEPLINRATLRAATVYAQKKAADKNIRIGFSITTNGTLITPDDADFFEQYGFSATISIDGTGDEHNKLRPMKGGAASYDRIIKNAAYLLGKQQKMQVSVRVTVTPENMNLPDILERFVDMAFHSIGFSPLLRSSSGKGEMTKANLKEMLASMIACGLQFENHVLQGKRFPFLNMLNAMKEIDKGTHRPYPCGAGAGYMGVSADGDLAACHRFVNDPAGAMGNIYDGVDPSLQNTWLSDRHVHQQSPCTVCWARYLCGGGCHHEVIEKGRHACDFIRGWLHYTIQARERLDRLAPGWAE